MRNQGPSRNRSSGSDRDTKDESVSAEKKFGDTRARTYKGRPNGTNAEASGRGWNRVSSGFKRPSVGAIRSRTANNISLNRPSKRTYYSGFDHDEEDAPSPMKGGKSFEIVQKKSNEKESTMKAHEQQSSNRSRFISKKVPPSYRPKFKSESFGRKDDAFDDIGTRQGEREEEIPPKRGERSGTKPKDGLPLDDLECDVSGKMKAEFADSIKSPANKKVFGASQDNRFVVGILSDPPFEDIQELSKSPILVKLKETGMFEYDSIKFFKSLSMVRVVFSSMEEVKKLVNLQYLEEFSNLTISLFSLPSPVNSSIAVSEFEERLRSLYFNNELNLSSIYNSIESFRFDNNEHTKMLVKGILKLFPSVRCIDFSSNAIQMLSWIKPLRLLSHLECLDFSNNWIFQEKNLIVLSEFPHLHELILLRNPIQFCDQAVLATLLRGLSKFNHKEFHGKSLINFARVDEKPPLEFCQNDEFYFNEKLRGLGTEFLAKLRAIHDFDKKQYTSLYSDSSMLHYIGPVNRKGVKVKLKATRKSSFYITNYLLNLPRMEHFGSFKVDIVPLFDDKIFVSLLGQAKIYDDSNSETEIYNMSRVMCVTSDKSFMCHTLSWHILNDIIIFSDRK